MKWCIQEIVCLEVLNDNGLDTTKGSRSVWYECPVSSEVLNESGPDILNMSRSVWTECLGSSEVLDEVGPKAPNSYRISDLNARVDGKPSIWKGTETNRLNQHEGGLDQQLWQRFHGSKPTKAHKKPQIATKSQIRLFWWGFLIRQEKTKWVSNLEGIRGESRGIQRPNSWQPRALITIGMVGLSIFMNLWINSQANSRKTPTNKHQCESLWGKRNQTNLTLNWNRILLNRSINEINPKEKLRHGGVHLLEEVLFISTLGGLGL